MVKIDDLVDKLVLNNMCKEEDKEIVNYGLTMGLEVGAMIITIIVLGLYYNLVVEGLLFFVSFSAIRTYTGGYHSQNGVNCYFSSSIIMIIFFLTIKFATLNFVKAASVSTLIVSVIIIVKLAPISTKNNPFDDGAKKYFRRRALINLFFESIFVFVLLVVGAEVYGFIITLAIFVASILVLVQRMVISSRYV